MTLDLLNVGEKARVFEIDESSNLYRRFLDIGITKNSKIECMLISPWNNPKAYLIRGAIIAIRNEDAKAIQIRNIEVVNE